MLVYGTLVSVEFTAFDSSQSSRGLQDFSIKHEQFLLLKQSMSCSLQDESPNPLAL